MYRIIEAILPCLIPVCGLRGLDMCSPRAIHFNIELNRSQARRYTRVHACASISGVMIASVAARVDNIEGVARESDGDLRANNIGRLMEPFAERTFFTPLIR